VQGVLVNRQAHADGGAVAVEFADEHVGGGLVGSIVDCDGGALGSEPPHDRGAESAATSGDDRTRLPGRLDVVVIVLTISLCCLL
jgi:hypothetical protein